MLSFLLETCGRKHDEFADFLLATEMTPFEERIIDRLHGIFHQNHDDFGVD